MVYILFFTIFPIIAFLLFSFYYFLDEDQKKYFWICIRNPKEWCKFGGQEGFSKGFTGRLPPVSLIHSTSVDKPEDTAAAGKRDFRDWMKNRVRLALPIPSIGGGSPLVSPMSPIMSGFSTATTLSAVNTPDELLLTPAGLPPPIDDKKLLLTPPVHRLRPAPPPPTPPKPRKSFAASSEAMETNGIQVLPPPPQAPPDANHLEKRGSVLAGSRATALLQRTPVRLGKDGNGRPGAETSSKLTEILRNQVNPQREQQSGWRQNIILQCILSADPPIRSILNHVIQSPWMDFFITIIIVPGCRAPRDDSSTSQ